VAKAFDRSKDLVCGLGLFELRAFAVQEDEGTDVELFRNLSIDLF